MSMNGRTESTVSKNFNFYLLYREHLDTYTFYKVGEVMKIAKY